MVGFRLKDLSRGREGLFDGSRAVLGFRTSAYLELGFQDIGILGAESVGLGVVYVKCYFGFAAIRSSSHPLILS